MRGFSVIFSVCAVLLVVTKAVWAENLAVVLGDRRSPFPSEDRQQVSTITQFLRGAGFRVFSAQNRSLREMRGVLGAARGYISSSDVEHVVIVVAGPFATEGGKVWALSDGARRVSGQNIASVGLPLLEIENAVRQAKGNQAVLLGLGYSHPAVIPPLQAGIGFSPIRDGKVIAAGSVPALRQVVTGGLLQENVSIGALRQVAPGVRWLAMPRAANRAFLSGGGAVAQPDMSAEVQSAEERGFWRAVRELGGKKAYEAYLETYPRGTYREAAQERLRDIEDAPRKRAEEAEARLGLSRSDRRQVQADLTLLGYKVGPIDGIFGRGTRGGLRRWQEAEGFNVSGYLDERQYRRLRAKAGEVERQRKAEEERRRQLEQERDRAFWRATGSSGDWEDLRLYLERYPKGLFAKEAKARLRQLRRDYVDPRALARDQQEERVVLDRKLSRVILEQQLFVMGLNPGLVDGKVDEATRRAVKAFQLARDLPATGFVGRMTFERIMNGR